MSEVWAAIPVKGLAGAKQRLSALLDSAQREALAAAMLEDVLTAVAGARVAGILVNTSDPRSAALARRYGAHVVTEDPLSGHTGAVVGMSRWLAREGKGAMLALPGDIPLVTAAELDAVIAASREAPCFTIAPAHDELGSNAVLCTPPDAVPLRFGDDSYFPHLAAARRVGLEPVTVRAFGTGLDIDHPADLRALLAVRPRRPIRTIALLEAIGV